jgi:hypothetical protein
MDSESNIAVTSWLVLCDVTARPDSNAPLSAGTVTVEPGITVHVTPSDDVEALKLVPLRVTLSHFGAVPPSAATCTVDAPDAERYCTVMPLPGVTSTP